MDNRVQHIFKIANAGVEPMYEGSLKSIPGIFPYYYRYDFCEFFFTSSLGRNFSMCSILRRVYPIMMAPMTRSHYFFMLIIFPKYYRGPSLLFLIPSIQNREFSIFYKMLRRCSFVCYVCEGTKIALIMF